MLGLRNKNSTTLSLIYITYTVPGVMDKSVFLRYYNHSSMQTRMQHWWEKLQHLLLNATLLYDTSIYPVKLVPTKPNSS